MDSWNLIFKHVSCISWAYEGRERSQTTRVFSDWFVWFSRAQREDLWRFFSSHLSMFNCAARSSFQRVQSGVFFKTKRSRSQRDHKHVALHKQDVTQTLRALMRRMCAALHPVSFYHIIFKKKEKVLE